MCVIYCTEQTSVKSVADSLMEELWSQVDALKKGYTGRVKKKSIIITCDIVESVFVLQ